MKKSGMFFGLVVTALMGANGLVSAEEVPQKVKDLAPKLAEIGSDPVIVSAVKAANAENKTLDQIKATDDKWRSEAGIADYMQALMDSECGKHLADIKEGAEYYTEMFVMDNQGANVCMSDKTSDYWQGDEDKFQKSFADGQGAIHIGEVEFDDSSQAYSVQVSVPVKDGGAVIGAITIGLDIEEID